MRGIGRKFRRLLQEASQYRPWRAQPSVLDWSAPGAAAADFVIVAHPAIGLSGYSRERIAAWLARLPTCDAVYTDEAHFYKPDWSPELLRALPYPGPFCILRPALLARLAATPPVDEAGFYDLWLRIAETGAAVGHVPEALFARTGLPELQVDACLAALQRHADRVFGPEAFHLRPAVRLQGWPPVFELLPKPADKPFYSVIIPTKDGLELLEPCVRSILERSSQTRLEILIVDNNSVQPETLAYFARVRAGELPGCRLVEAPFPFNWSRVNNVGAAAANGDVLVFMNNDMEVIAPDWLDWLGGYALQPDIGVAGACLLREDGLLQHAGIVIGLGGWCDHLYDRQPPELAATCFVPPGVIRDVSAVTGACMAVAAKTFASCGGFDEAYQVCGSDVEYCLRLQKQGLRTVYLPPARLYHLESRTRETDGPDPDRDRFRALLRPYRRQGDPYYNANLSLYDNCGTMRNRWE